LLLTSYQTGGFFCPLSHKGVIAALAFLCVNNSSRSIQDPQTTNGGSNEHSALEWEWVVMGVKAEPFFIIDQDMLNAEGGIN